MALPQRQQLTYDDYLHLPADGRRYEIIEGELYVTPSPFTRHQRIVSFLDYAVGWFVREHDLGEAYPAPWDVVLSKVDVVQPDFVFVSRERAAIVTAKNVQGAPDLAIEILSPSTRKVDEEIKRKRYERFGVAEYWIVDPDSESIRVYRRDGARFAAPVTVTAAADDMLSSALLPGWRMSVRQCFA